MINFYEKTKIKYKQHSQTRFKQRYGNYDSELIKDLKICIRSDRNIIYVKKKNDSRNHYIILYSDYYSLIYDKKMDEIVTFLPINKFEKKEIEVFEKRKYKEFS